MRAPCQDRALDRRRPDPMDPALRFCLFRGRAGRQRLRVLAIARGCGNGHAEQVAGHAQRAEGPPFGERQRRLAGSAAQARDVGERQEVFSGRHRQRVVRVGGDIDQIGRSRRHDAAHVGVEALGPVEAAVAVRPVDPAQVVHHVAAAEDEDALLAQRRETRPQIEVVGQRRGRMDRQLNDRHVGRGEDVCQHRPRPVIEAPAVLVEADLQGRERIGDFLCHLGAAGGRVVEGEQLGREAVEVVDHARPCHGRDGRALDEPVRRDAQHRPRPRQGPSESSPRTGEVVDLQRSSASRGR